MTFSYSYNRPNQQDKTFLLMCCFSTNQTSYSGSNQTSYSLFVQKKKNKTSYPLNTLQQAEPRVSKFFLSKISNPYQTKAWEITMKSLKIIYPHPFFFNLPNGGDVLCGMSCRSQVSYKRKEQKHYFLFIFFSYLWEN